MDKTHRLTIVAWVLGLAVILAAITVWIGTLHGIFRLNSYVVFPLLGLLAFSLMWTHYIIGALRRFYNVPKKELASYFKITGIVVLASILLHPTILIFQLWRDGFGLPPESYLEHYVAPGGKIAVLLGSMSFVIFLLFELKAKFGSRSWWKFVDYAQVAAMTAIFYHALTLGSALQVDWYRTLWFIYGITFIIAVSYIYVFSSAVRGSKV